MLSVLISALQLGSLEMNYGLSPVFKFKWVNVSRLSNAVPDMEKIRYVSATYGQIT